MKRGVIYFAMVFAAGFILGAIRVIWIVPVVGVRAAELLEAPLMLAVIVLAARFTIQRFPAKRRVEYLYSGAVALIILLLMEFTVVLGLQNMSIPDYFQQRDPVAGLVYVIMLMVFALMPWLAGGRSMHTPGKSAANEDRQAS